MTIAFWCVLIAGLLPYVAVAVAKWDKRFDNRNPRDWLATREGKARRAHAAHLNSFEALPLFAAGVLIASFLKASPNLVDTLAAVFVLARVAYIWAYIEDQPTFRSIVWLIGLAATIALFVVATSAK
jgi:uncharacterized MAPEG superfamily protein